jgi:uncharacterized protein YkwD
MNLSASNPISITRRSFLQAAGTVALGFRLITRGQTPIERGRFNENDLPLAREQLLKMVNRERDQQGLSKLELDDLACKVASEHAAEMSRLSFLSHWGADGRKPYHRYSFAGGTDAVQENASSADDIESISSTGVLLALRDMHQSMIDEVPPNDGHRKTILFPQHTHVGFGIALQGYSVRLDELYIGRYVDIDPIPRQAKPKTTVLLSGKLLSRKHNLTGAHVYYEPLPRPPDISWLRELRSYGMPGEKEALYPRLPDPYRYADGTNGTIEVDRGRFRVSIGLSKKPGINTIMLWLREGEDEVDFPGAQVCIRVE